MLHRLLYLLGGLALLLGATSALAAERIVAIGDLHGDHQAWRAIAQSARIMDRRGRWAGGGTILVQTGDIVDRGPDSLKIIDDLMRLQRQAARAGGRVVVVTGNHEAMMVTGDLRYVHPGEYAAFVTGNSEALREAVFRRVQDQLEQQEKARDPTLTRQQIRDNWYAQHPLGWLEHRQAWAPTGRLGKWVIANPVATKIGSTLFVHGGISAEYARLPLDELNRQAARELTATSLEEGALINDALGPLWYRGLVTREIEDTDLPAAAPPTRAPNPVRLPPRPSIYQELATVLGAYRAKRIVVGHTPSRRGIIIDQGGRLVRIDTGISAYYGGPLSYLEIIGDRLVAHTVPRPATGERNR